jgi:hypothetical protein
MLILLVSLALSLCCNRIASAFFFRTYLVQARSRNRVASRLANGLMVRGSKASEEGNSGSIEEHLDG